MIETFHHIILEHKNDYLLPESEKNSDLDSEKLKQSGVGTQRFVECMIEQNQVIQRVRSRNGNNPADTGRNQQISTMVSWNIVLFVFLIVLVGIDDVH